MKGKSKEKREALKKFILKHTEDGILIAFSGGVDSSTLGAIVHKVAGEQTAAATAISPTYPEQKDKVKQIVNEIGIKHFFIETEELNHDQFTQNPTNRCYYCKKKLINTLKELARSLGFKVIFEGTTKSDLSGHRPGYKAIMEEENVYSPWARFNFKKEEIRHIARELNLSIHAKPPLACLASRIPFNEKITRNRLQRIYKAEKFIREELNITQLRVRDHNGIARIEVGKEEREKFFDEEVMDKIGGQLKKLGFDFVTLNLQGYQRGSMLRTSRD